MNRETTLDDMLRVFKEIPQEAQETLLRLAQAMTEKGAGDDEKDV